MAKMQVPRSVLIALVAAAVSATLALVFVLGKEYGRRTPAEVRSDSTGPAAVPAAAPMSPTPPTPAPVPEVKPAEPVHSVPALAAPESLATPSQNDPARSAVAAYFKAVDDVQPNASGNPEAVAQQVVAGLGKGDTSGFDEMIQQAQRTRSRMAAIAAPQPCAAFHRESLASLDAGLDLMRAMKKALSSSEPGPQVASLTDQANALKARSEALQAQEAALRQRYGVIK